MCRSELLYRWVIMISSFLAWMDLGMAHRWLGPVHWHCLMTSETLLTFFASQAPLAMDTSGSHVIIAAAPLDITVFRVDLTGALGPQDTAVAVFTLVRQLSIMGSGHPLQVKLAGV